MTKTIKQTFLAFVSTVLLISAFDAAQAKGGGDFEQRTGNFDARVVGVSDGDTITVLTEAKSRVKIRLAFVDAPESSQPFGRASKQAMSDLVFAKQVQLRCASSTDRYGRSICTVLVDGRDANLALLSQGLAWHFTKYIKDQSAPERVRFDDAQRRAMSSKAGLWADANPVAPWDFRKQKRQAD